MSFFNRLSLKAVSFGRDRTNVQVEDSSDLDERDSISELMIRGAKSKKNDANVDSSSEEEVSVYRPPPIATKRKRSPKYGDNRSRKLPIHKNAPTLAGKPKVPKKKVRIMETPTRDEDGTSSLITPTPCAKKNNDEDDNNDSEDSDEEIDAAAIVAEGDTVSSPQKSQVSPKKATRSPSTKAKAASKAKPWQPPVKSGI